MPISKITYDEQLFILTKLLEAGGHDFRNFMPELVAHRFEILLQQINVDSVDELCQEIETDENIREKIIDTLYISSTELFRNPSLWKELSILLIKKFSDLEHIDIWIPRCISGEELYSLQIILGVLNLTHKTKLIINTPTKRHKQKILNAEYKATQLEINLRETEDKEYLERYLNYDDNKVQVATDLFENNFDISISHYNTIDADKKFDLILFRNRLLELNQTGCNETLETISTHLKPNGYLILGHKERITGNMLKNFKLISKSNAIYKKKNIKTK